MVSKFFLCMGMVLGMMSSFLADPFIMGFNILQMGSLDLDLCVLVDWMTLVFSSVLCIMVSCVLKFSDVYMDKDIFVDRFTYLVLSFVFSMICLIYIPHFFFLLLGWDGLGLTSFLLVMYYLSDSSWAAGMKTFLMNRMGDSFFVMGLVLFLSNGYWDIISCSGNDLLALMMVLGSFTKSAQFPFSSWLPAAMAAPTPVSALVHSSTLVTAGVYVMIRFCHMFPSWLFFVMGMSGMWTLYSASLAACCEFDSKKVVAYSTLSQLGLMMVAMSLKLPKVAFFHLITHAMFKALMFISVGYLIHKSGHFQDLRSLKGLWMSSPLLASALLMSSLSLMGFPFLAGFFSKELILEKNMLMMKTVFHFLLLLSLPLTSYYGSRLCFKLFKGVNYSSITCSKDSKVNFWAMFPLYFGSIFSGIFLSHYVYSLSSMYPCHAMKMIVFLLMSSGMLLSWFDVKMKKCSLLFFFGSICFLTPFNGSFWVNKTASWGKAAFSLMDQGFFSNMIKDIDFSSSSVSEFLHNIFAYFLSPQSTYYMISMFGMVASIGLVKF